jgi:arsenate reductase (glutaredoxin)
MKVYGLPHCSTTKKAVALLEAKGYSVSLIDYREHPLGIDELDALLTRSNVPLQQWFNTSGQAYRDQKDELLTLSRSNVIKRFAANPMLLKRPIVVTTDNVWVGIPKGGY